MRFILDAHLDLALNALRYDRDQLKPISELRALEAGMIGKCRASCTVSLPEMRRGRIGICLATVLSRARPAPSDDPGGLRQRGEALLREDLDHDNQTIASAFAQAELAYYRMLERGGHLRMIRTRSDLDETFTRWQSDDTGPVGILLSMEGTDPIVDPDHAEWWWRQGLRTACLAHYGQSPHAMGTGGDGPLTPAGRDLLAQFNRLGLILDLVHTADTALDEAMEIYEGPVFVSHGNCRSLVPGDRQITDEQIRRIAERGGVLGAALDCWMLHPEWRKGAGCRDDVELSRVADQIDHNCQLLGNCRHVGIGSDLDGGFGTEQSPSDLDTIADLHKLEDILAERGYGDEDLDAVFHENWIGFFREALPA